MNFNELVRLRSSIRGYEPDKAVEKDKLLRILEAGRMAPSAKNNQPWTFVVITSAEVLKEVHTAYARDWFWQAPVVIVVKGRREDAWERKYDNYNALETDLTIAMDHIILAATAEGLGTCWIAAFEPEILHKALGLKPEEVVFALTPLGYPSEKGLMVVPKVRKPLSSIVEWR